MPQHPDTPKWRELASKELRVKTPEPLNWKTPEGILVKPLYTAEEVGYCGSKENWSLRDS